MTNTEPSQSEAVFHIRNYYIHIQDAEGEYDGDPDGGKFDYTIYDEHYHDLDGGVIGEPDWDILRALGEITMPFIQDSGVITEIDVSAFLQAVDKAYDLS